MTGAGSSDVRQGGGGAHKRNLSPDAGEVRSQKLPRRTAEMAVDTKGHRAGRPPTEHAGL